MSRNTGSTWRKWDLHIHTPASHQWSGKKLASLDPTERDQIILEIIEKINATDVDVFGVMDYWNFLGFLAIREYAEANPETLKKLVLPGIELRLEAPTSYKLNTHVIFDSNISEDDLNVFLSNLRLGGKEERPLTRDNFIKLAQNYDNGKLASHGRKPEDRDNADNMYLLGQQTAQVTRQSLRSAIQTVGIARCLLIQPYDTNDGLDKLDWKKHPYDDAELMQWADIFETRDYKNVDLFLGRGIEGKPEISKAFIQNLGGSPKPVVAGSDAHRTSDYGKFPSGKATWLKAQPSFAGLRHVCNEPATRCYIGERPPKLIHVDSNPTKYIQRLRIAKRRESTFSETWFANIDLPINPGLVAIIGNRGSGKSALADIIAITGNTHTTKMEFLNERRFCGNPNKAVHFAAQITWNDGEKNTIKLSDGPTKDQPERVRYLPQQSIEALCNEIASDSENGFSKELKKVIFSHVPFEARLGKTNLDELIEFRTQPLLLAANWLRQNLTAINRQVAGIEEKLTEESAAATRNQLALKEKELEAHDKTKPAEIDKPGTAREGTDAAKKLNTLEQEKERLETLERGLDEAATEKNKLTLEATGLERISSNISNLKDTVANFIQDHEDEFKRLGLVIHEVVVLRVKDDAITGKYDAVKSRLAEVKNKIDGRDDSPGFAGAIQSKKEEIRRLQADLDAPQKRYQEYLTNLKAWTARRQEIVGTPDTPGTLEALKVALSNIEDVLPSELAALRRRRIDLVSDIHSKLLEQLDVFKDLYGAVQAAADVRESANEALRLRFEAALMPQGLTEAFFEFIARNKKGNFYGEVESEKKLTQVVSACDFSKRSDVEEFLDAIIEALTKLEQDGETSLLTIETQLRAKKTKAEFYDFMFGLRYLVPKYTLKQGDKELSQLSPGEKGGLLLVFYLLLDREEIPIIIDQPEHNLDNESVVRLLVNCIREASTRRQVIVVTHNPNLAIFCDADQVIHAKIDKEAGNKIEYSAGAIEDHDMNERSVNVLEGTYNAFDNRRRKYFRPAAETNTI